MLPQYHRQVYVSFYSQTNKIAIRNNFFAWQSKRPAFQQYKVIQKSLHKSELFYFLPWLSTRELLWSSQDCCKLINSEWLLYPLALGIPEGPRPHKILVQKIVQKILCNCLYSQLSILKCWSFFLIEHLHNFQKV